MTYPQGQPVIDEPLVAKLAAYTGQWVAVDLQEVVGSGATAREAYEAAVKAGHTDPLVFQVSEHPERVAFL